jgi:adenylosuccinate lyase
MGLERQKAYELVQRNALQVWETGKEFKALLQEDPDIRRHLTQEDLDRIFDLDYHLKHVDALFDRVFT